MVWLDSTIFVGRLVTQAGVGILPVPRVVLDTNWSAKASVVLSLGLIVRRAIKLKLLSTGCKQ